MPDPDSKIETRVDDALDSSFPASDPPCWTLGPPEWAPASPSPATTERDPLQRLRRDHANLSGLAMAFESMLARAHEGEAVDRKLLVEVVDYLVTYLERVHGPREERAMLTTAASAPALQALQPILAASAEDVVAAAAVLERKDDRDASSAADLVRTGFAFTRALRARMAFEDSVVLPSATLGAGASHAVEANAELAEADARIDDDYRARFEALTAVVGCGCAFE